MNNFEITSKLRDIYRELSEKHDFRCKCYIDIIISNRLRSSNGLIKTTKSRATGEMLSVQITMSRALLTEFGWDRFESTFRHEVAHLADTILNNRSGHSHSFKRLCLLFGGSMNQRMAGSLYSQCADTAYVKPIAKWIYTCPCGFEKKMAKRMAEKKRGSSGYRCGKCKIHRLNTWEETKVV